MNDAEIEEFVFAVGELMRVCLRDRKLRNDLLMKPEFARVATLIAPNLDAVLTLLALREKEVREQASLEVAHG